MFASLECCLAETGLCHGGRRQWIRCRQLARERPGQGTQAGGALSVDVTMGLSEHVVMPPDIRCSGRRSLERVVPRMESNRKDGQREEDQRKEDQRTGSYREVALRKERTSSGKKGWEEYLGKNEAENGRPWKEKRRSEERLVLPGTARGSGRAPWGSGLTGCASSSSCWHRPLCGSRECSSPGR